MLYTAVRGTTTSSASVRPFSLFSPSLPFFNTKVIPWRMRYVHRHVR
jgi:hypothetical protein